MAIKAFCKNVVYKEENGKVSFNIKKFRMV